MTKKFVLLCTQQLIMRQNLGNLLLEEEEAGAAAELVGGEASVMKNKPDI
jgi:hypothetical protein